MAADLNPRVWKQLNSRKKEEIVCDLSCFPGLTKSEIAVVAGIGVGYVSSLIHKGRVRGLKSKSDVAPHAGRNTPPSRDELVWRLRNQTTAQIAARFGAETERLLAGHGLLNLAPDELKQLGAGDTPVAAPPAPVTAVELPGSGISIAVESEAEARLVDSLIASYQDRFALRPSHWVVIRPVIDTRLDFERMRAARPPKDRDEEWAGKIATIQNRLADAEKKLRDSLPDRSQADAGDLFQHAIDNALDLLDQRGYRYTLDCPHCGTVLAPYLFLYRNTVAAAALARKILAESGFATLLKIDRWKQMAQEILDLEATHPFLHNELRDLGLAWISAPVGILYAAQAKHPEAITDDLIRRVAAAMLEVSEVAIDKGLPFSPLNRLVRTESGEIRVVTPEP